LLVIARLEREIGECERLGERERVCKVGETDRGGEECERERWLGIVKKERETQKKSVLERRVREI
jgi:hypothetical protein